MPHPVWVGDGFAAVLIVVGGYCLARLVAVVPLDRQTHVDVNVGHLLMAVAMTGMLVPGWHTLPDDVWGAAFLTLGLWFLGRVAWIVTRDGIARLSGPDGLHARHYAVHGVMAFAMVYMDAVARTAPGSSGGGMAMGARVGVPSLTLLFMVVLLASAVWQLNGIQAFTASPAVVSAGVLVGASGPSVGEGVSGGAGAPSGPGAPGERPWLAPRLEVGCHIAMCLAMAYMLVLVV